MVCDSKLRARGLLAGLIVAAGLVTTGCPPPEKPPEESKIAEGIFGRLGEAMELADDEQRELFERGRDAALRRFAGADGLGPSFNTSRCVSCHEQPAFGGASPRYRNFFLIGESKSTGFELVDKPPSRPHDDRPETYEAPKAKSSKSGVQLRYRSSRPRRNRMPDRADVTATRNAIPFFGIGAIAQIPDRVILKREDPNDRDGDGISGRVNVGETGAVGRFGLKAQTGSLEGFVRGPMFNHVGITTAPLTPRMRRRLPLTGESQSEGRRLGALRQKNQHQVATPDEPLEDSDGVSDPEMSREELFELISWVRLLAAPEPEELTETTKHGKKVFESIGCADCHVPSLEGPRGEVPAYTDLLLHDMGEELADGIAQADAKASEFRTQPLWGIAATEPYLHDGRAETIDEAIRMHGGEATRAKNNYTDLPESDRRDVLQFLRSLGGAERDSEGRIPPEAPVPEPGSFEAPLEGLSDREIGRFDRGRRLFDRDTGFAEGLGPAFNGDSCRACHFEPTPGGAGPPGVNVTREGHLASDGTFTAPPGGTLLHRFSGDRERRPSPHERSNVFELRQPPPLYGLGLVDAIPDWRIERHADPQDLNGDGITGRVARLENGKLGRFGWKAAFPTLEDFARDALTNEMGLTVPERAGVTAGRSDDGDDVADPEFAGSKYDALIFYLDSLAPPPDPEDPEGDVDLGEQLFETVGCADCHVPEMQTRDGRVLEVYSDFLLHRVMPKDYRGVGERAAGPREFRTPPLWGIGSSGPYMHDGLAGTLDAAIRRHAAEASAAAKAYENLSKERRQALVSFLNSL